MRLRSLCLVMVLLASPFAAQAQPFQGLYIGAGAGVYWPESINVQTAVLGSSRTQLDPSVGFAGLASVGYALGNGFRFELEGNYRTADISRGTGPGLSTFSGTAQTYGAWPTCCSIWMCICHGCIPTSVVAWATAGHTCAISPRRPWPGRRPA